MTPRPILLVVDDEPQLLKTADLASIVVAPIDSPGPLLDVAYQLLQRTFTPDVLDAKEGYLERLSPNASEPADYLPCVMAALADSGAKTLLLGVSSADLMWLRGTSDRSFLAIGNMAISPLCRGMGIGSQLYRATIDRAREMAAAQSRSLACVVLESEDRSLGFWRKMGFRWPKDTLYFQPPLEWTDAGKPVHEEVRETLLLAPVDPDAPLTLTGEDLKGIISTLYENWSLRGIRGTLTPEAMATAEQYLATHVTRPVFASITPGELELVDPLRAHERDQPIS